MDRSTASQEAKLRSSIITAANWEQSNNDLTYKAFCNVMAQRKLAAKAILNAKTNDEDRDARRQFDYLNNRIKEVLHL